MAFPLNKAAFMAYDRIGSYFANDWLRILTVFIAGAVYDAGIILIPFLQGLRIDWALAQKPFPDILYLTLGFLGTFWVLMVCRFVKKNEIGRFSNKATD